MYKYKVVYNKHFNTGILAGITVPCSVLFVENKNAAQFVEHLKSSDKHKDVFTKAVWTLEGCNIEEIM